MKIHPVSCLLSPDKLNNSKRASKTGKRCELGALTRAETGLLHSLSSGPTGRALRPGVQNNSPLLARPLRVGGQNPTPRSRDFQGERHQPRFDRPHIKEPLKIRCARMCDESGKVQILCFKRNFSWFKVLLVWRDSLEALIFTLSLLWWRAWQPLSPRSNSLF